MAIEIKMPALSPTMEEGTLAKWLVKEGDTVKSGDIMAEIETDKATMEFEAVDEGVIAKILVAEGTDNVKVGTAIALLAEEGEDVASAAARPRPPPPKRLRPRRCARSKGRAGERHAQAGRRRRAGSARLAGNPGRDRDGEAHRPRSAARRDGRGNARRRPRLRDGRGSRPVSGRVQGHAGLLDEFGDRRVIDTPITEYGFAGVGTGAAMGGLRPVIEFMTFNFAMQAIDHIINSAAKTNYMSGGQMRCPIVFRGPNGAASRVGAQHSQNYGPWYASVPGLIVIAPYDAADAKGLLKAAIRSEDPVVFLENELMYGRSFDVPKLDDFVLPIGKARIMREGKDVTLVSYSIGVGVALEAAEKLAAEGIDAEVIDLRTLRPLDTKTVLKSLAKTNRLVVVEEGWPTCSIASEITAVVMEEGFDDLDAPVLRVTNEDVPLPYAANLEKLALVDANKVVAAVKKVTYRG